MIDVYSLGFCTLSVCVPEGMTVEEITADVNKLHPTGISSEWSIAADPTFHTGEPNPCVCENDPRRRHYLMHC
jgi:hypothetical protein